MRNKVFAVLLFVCLCLCSQAYADDVEIDESNFPDESFRQYVSTHFDTDGDGFLSDSEAASVTSIPAGITYSMTGTNTFSYSWSDDLALPTEIETLEGIGYFVSLDVLGVAGTSITDLDTGGNVSLTALICNDNPNLGTLYIGENVKYLVCHRNASLTDLDAGSNTALLCLNCSDGNIYSLYVPENLVSLDCSHNNLMELDTTGDTALRYLDCSENLISELDLTANTALTHLYCQGNFLFRLNLSACTSLTANSATSQDVTGSLPYETGDEETYPNYPYAYDFSEMMYDEDLANLSAANIKAYDSRDVEISSTKFNTENEEPSVLLCASEPYRIVYEYNTGRSNYPLNVTLYLDGTNGRSVEEPRFFTSTSRVLTNGTAGQTYNDTLAMPKGARPYAYSVTSGDLPEGLAVYSDDLYGYISGIPTETGTFTFVVTASNGYGEADMTYTLTVADSSYVPTISPDTLPEAWQGLSYDFTFSATSSSSDNISWSCYDDNIPDGLTLSGDTLTGTPTTAGTYTFRIIAANSYGYASADFSLTVNALVLPSISTTTLSVGMVNTYYSADLTATGTPTPTWTLIDGALPSGLSMDASGDITGTPTAAGVFEFTVQAENTGGTDSADLRIIINAEGSPTITTTSLADGIVGQSYSADLAVSSVVSEDEAVWSLASGDLPDGLSLDTAGTIYGTPTTAGTFTFIVGYTDPTGSASCDLSITVTTITAPTITTSSLSSGTVGVSYTASLSASGTTPITWSKTSGDLPGGLTLSTSGDISGTPTTAGTFAFVVQAVNDAGTDSADLSITIASADAPGLPIILTTSLASGTRGIAYTASLSAAGAPTISWSLTSGDLPGGLTLSTSGDISGTPTTAGTFTFTVQAVNSVGSASRSFTITIAAPTLPGSPTITTTSLSSGTSGTAYSAVLTATGTTPITWSVTSGSLPTGLTLSSAGVISGTPTATGRYTFTVTAQNSAGSASRQLTLRIVAASSGGDTSTTRTAPTISTSSVSAGTAGSSYTYTLTASGSTPIIWSLVSGSLPSGLRLSSSGVISGTPTTTGTFTFVVQARNTAGSVTQSLTLTVNAASSSAVAPSISTSSLPDATEGTSYTANLTATGTTPITWRVGSGSLPSGLTLSSSGTISGTPAESGIFRFSVNAENSAGTDSKTFTLTVEAASGPAAGTAPTITVSVQPVSGKVGVLYSFTLQAQGTAPITWRTTDGSLPLGLGLSSNGTISGTPTFAGEYMFGVEAVNEWGTSSATFTIKIASEAGEVVEVDDIVRGPARTVEDLSEEDLAEISGDLIAAIMPSLRVNEAGNYSFRINIDEAVPVGYTLVWHSFPRIGNDGYGASFTDSSGNTTTTVPSNRAVTVSVYLAQNTYWPVVSAHASSGGNNNVVPDTPSSGGGGGGGCEAFGLGLSLAGVLVWAYRRESRR